MKLLRVFLLAVSVLVSITTYAFAREIDKKPLNEVFDNTVIIPFNYQGKVFLNGQKTDVFGDYKLFQRNGRVLVPLRLIGYLATEMDRNKGYWDVTWDPKKPDDVLMYNYQMKKTVKLKVNSKTMYINNKPQTIDMPPQKIQGRIVLPLRSVSQAIEKKIEWLDGLIILSTDLIDLQSPQTLTIKDKIKTKLADARKEPDYEKRVTLITKHQNTVYYFKSKYINNKNIQELYKKAGSQKEVKIDLPGEENFNNFQVINNELYYVSVINGKATLNIFYFANNKTRKLCSLDWTPSDGWIGGMKYINNNFYIVLHSGDLTMGSEVLYKLENNQLKEIARAKSFIRFDVAGDYLYYTDFHPMFSPTQNLVRVNLKTGAKEVLGQKEFSYGISRTIEPNGGVTYSGDSPLFIKDGYIYTLGFKDADEKDKSCVYKISLDGKTQKKLTDPAGAFRLVDNAIYYEDIASGYLMKVDLEGKNKKILVNKRIINFQIESGNIYYTAVSGSNSNLRLGYLYKFNLATGKETKLSDKSVSEFYVGKAGVYYKSDGYDLGLYKIDAVGNNISLVKDTIYNALLSDEGMVYTLRYAEGVYSVK